MAVLFAGPEWYRVLVESPAFFHEVLIFGMLSFESLLEPVLPRHCHLYNSKLF